MRKSTSGMVGMMALLMAAAAPAPAAAQKSDARILGEMAGADRGEVMIATWVRDHAHSAGVRSYARTLVRDHSAGLTQVQATGRRAGVTPSAAASRDKVREANQALATLRSKRGAEMDAAFVSHAIEDHRADIASAEQDQAAAHHAAVKRLVTNTLPVLRRHLSAAEALQGHTH